LFGGLHRLCTAYLAAGITAVAGCVWQDFNHSLLSTQICTMSDEPYLSKPFRTGGGIVFSCLTTLLAANHTILRPDPVTTAFERTLLVLLLHAKTVLFPQLVLFEAVTHYGTAMIIRDRVNAAARLCHKASLASHNVAPATNPSQTLWDKMKSWIFGNTVESLRLVWSFDQAMSMEVIY
jgi:hypothetical protein